MNDVINVVGISGGKDSTLLCQLIFEMLERLTPEERNKKVYIVTSDTMVENPIVKNYMYKMSELIGSAGKKWGIISNNVHLLICCNNENW